MDPFARLIPDARAFLGELAANNNRDWFTAHKARYETDLKAPATLLLDQIAHDIGRETGLALTPKLFRAHRDVRFSKDKTPYHTHLHMLWSIDLHCRQRPGLFFGISPDYVTVGGGIMGFDKPVLLDWRQLVDGPFGDKVQNLLEQAAESGLALREPEMKRVPTPYAKDHRHADLLRRKGLVLWRDVAATEHAAPLTALKAAYHDLSPVLQGLRPVL
ncbi:TIGR02453 family protein [Sedimentitalea todarodis]|uniref:TIGR02453 family protein n=1 Tax=Sedimentitalea todarodis TaxID=1631240 RepID=A0ABU3VEJ3_9RHOB|nr:TIGR02453 family protein [Sedimentitalea todarodis]MDU9004593.1 TIGR02453 family protein [Sedimentitalea todarodis]